MLHAFEPDVSGVILEGLGDGVFAVGELGAIDAAAGEEAGDAGDADAEDLFREDVIHALLQGGDLLLQAYGEAAGDLAEEDAGLGAGIEEGDGLVRPEVRAAVVGGPCLGEGVEHAVGEFRRGEDLVVGEVRDAGEHIRIPPAQGEGGLLAHGVPSFAAAASSLTVIGG